MKKYILLIIILTLSGYRMSAQAPKNIDLLGSLTIPGQTLAGCWHYNSHDGKEYALAGAANGIVIIDITDPANPTLLFQLPGLQNLWHEVKVNGDYAYAVSEATAVGDSSMNGIQVIDLRYLPDSVPNKFYHGDDSITNQLLTSHTITTSGHYLFANGHNLFSLGRGILIFDITDPWNPHYVGHEGYNYCHDSFVRGDTLWASEIQNGQFSVYNIADVSNPILMAVQSTPNNFNHNAWLSDDSHYLYTTDERDHAPVGVFDVSNLLNINLIDTFFNTNFHSFEVHNVRVLNDFLINPSYGSQLTIADAAYPSNLIEIGNYTTGSSLCWDADPYLNSGNIIATDMSSGIFYVFRPHYVRACYLRGNVTDSITHLNVNNVYVTILPTSAIRRSDLFGNYETGIPDSGLYSVQFNDTEYVTKTIDSVRMTNGVITTLDVQLVPLTNGIKELLSDHIIVTMNSDFSQLNIHSGNYEVLNVRLISPSGQLIRNIPMKNSGDFIIPVPEICTGIYSVDITTKEGSIGKRFFVNK